MKNSIYASLTVITLSFLAACAEKGSDAGATGAALSASPKSSGSAAPATVAASASAASSAAAAVSAAPTAAASAAPADDAFATFKDLDLSSFHKLWKGFSVKAPEGATVKQGSGGPVISKGKEFGIQFSFTDTSLDNTVANTKECVNYDMKCAVVERTKDLVITSSTYKSSGKDVTTYAFHMLVRPGGTFMACKSDSSVEERAKLDILMKACSSITKS